MTWWSGLSHGRQAALVVPVVGVLGFLAFRALGDGWGEAAAEGGGTLVLGVVLGLVLRRRRRVDPERQDDRGHRG